MRFVGVVLRLARLSDVHHVPSRGGSRLRLPQRSFALRQKLSLGRNQSRQPANYKRQEQSKAGDLEVTLGSEQSHVDLHFSVEMLVDFSFGIRVLLHFADGVEEEENENAEKHPEVDVSLVTEELQEARLEDSLPFLWRGNR